MTNTVNFLLESGVSLALLSLIYILFAERNISDLTGFLLIYILFCGKKHFQT